LGRGSGWVMCKEGEREGERERERERERTGIQDDLET
jgi:hypothetical protein